MLLIICLQYLLLQLSQPLVMTLMTLTGSITLFSTPTTNAHSLPLFTSASFTGCSVTRYTAPANTLVSICANTLAQTSDARTFVQQPTMIQVKNNQATPQQHTSSFCRQQNNQFVPYQPIIHQGVRAFSQGTPRVNPSSFESLP